MARVKNLRVFLLPACDAERVIENYAARLGGAGDRRGGIGHSRTSKRNMAFGCEQSRSRIETDPAGAWNVYLRPRMKSGEI